MHTNGFSLKMFFKVFGFANLVYRFDQVGFLLNGVYFTI